MGGEKDTEKYVLKGDPVMKRRTIQALLLAAGLALSLAACGAQPAESTQEAVAETAEEPVEEVYDPEPTGRLLYGDGTLFNPYVFLWSFSDIIDADAIVYLFHGGEMPGDPDDGTEEDGGGEEEVP